MGHLFITGKSVSWESSWDLVAGLLRTLSLAITLADSGVPLNLASIRTWQQNGGMEGVVREDVTGTGMVPNRGTQYSGSLTYFYLISSYCLNFFSKKWSLKNGLVSEAHLCLLLICLLNLHTELEKSSLPTGNFTFLGNRVPSYSPKKKCSETILLRTGIPVWGSVPPYLVMHLCLELPLPIAAWKVSTELQGQGVWSLGGGGVKCVVPLGHQMAGALGCGMAS